MADAKVPTAVPTKHVRTHQPTYRLDPKKPFSVDIVEKILSQIIDPELKDMEYNEKVIPEVCLTLADTIKNAIKQENFDRYRIIVAISIGQSRQQSTHVYHTFLWDHERDGYAAHDFQNCHLYANVVVYGVYLD